MLIAVITTLLDSVQVYVMSISHIQGTRRGPQACRLTAANASSTSWQLLRVTAVPALRPENPWMADSMTAMQGWQPFPVWMAFAKQRQASANTPKCTFPRATLLGQNLQTRASLKLGMCSPVHHACQWYHHHDSPTLVTHLLAFEYSFKQSADLIHLHGVAMYSSRAFQRYSRHLSQHKG